MSPQHSARPAADPAWVWLLLLLPLAAAGYALREYPQAIRKSAEQVYALNVGYGSLLKMAAVYYGLYLVPGLIAFARLAPASAWWRAFASRRVLLSFALGMTAHVAAILLQKTLHLAFRPPGILACLALAYLLLIYLLNYLPIATLLQEPEAAGPVGWERGAATALLTLGLVLGLEMTLRGRASSLSLTGDAYPHLINTLGTLLDGPMPDGLPFFSTFVLNIHPMAFHALLANLKTLTPGLLHIDLLRYFSVVMIPVFLLCMQGFFSFLGNNRVIGAVGACAALWISGGGLSLKIPIAFFPWYWSIAWCLSAAVFFLLLRSELCSPVTAFAAGLVFGAGCLLHPFFAFRMGMIMAFFLPLELARRLACRQALAPMFSAAWRFALAAVLPVAAWLVPLLLKHPWEQTYSYDTIVKNFAAQAPEGIEYLKAMKGTGFHLLDFWGWAWPNAGLVPCLFAPLGLAAVLRRRGEPAAALLVAWPLAMGSVILFSFLPNPYRYFEYFFFGLLALAVYGLGWFAGYFSGWSKKLLLAVLLVLSAWQVHRDFFPKYRLALSLYGWTSMSELDVRSAESRAYRYFDSKQAGRLDLEYGGYRGYLWSRQKKVWDIYLQTKKPRPPVPEK